MPTLPLGACEFVAIPLTVHDGGRALDAAEVTVSVAVKPDGVRPVGEDWRTAAWDEGRVTYLIDTTLLAAGWHDVWLRIAAGAETTIRRVRPGLSIQ